MLPATLWGNSYAKTEYGDLWKTATERVTVLRKHPKDAKVWICAMHAYDDDEDNVHEKDITKYHVDEFPSGKDEVGVPQGSDDAGSDESDLFEESEGDEPPPKKHKKVQGPPG